MPKGVFKHPSQCGFQKGHPCYLTEESKKKISEGNKGKKLSKEVREHLSIIHKGKVAHNKGKKMSEKQKEKIRQSHLKRWDRIGRKSQRPRHDRSEYKTWKLKVFQRDNFTCQGCNKVGGNLEAHHIKSFAKFPDLRCELENGVTLCKDCHKLTDGYAQNV